MRDTVISELIQQEHARQTHGVELIASENYASDQVMAAQGSVLTNKYAEGLPGKRYYGGCGVVDQVEDIARQRLCQLFGAEWANVQPHSGASANSAVMLAVLKPGDKIMGFDLAHGGHLTHGSPVNYSGKLYDPVFYGVEEETGTIDMDKVAETADVRSRSFSSAARRLTAAIGTTSVSGKSPTVSVPCSSRTSATRPASSPRAFPTIRCPIATS